MRFALMVLWMLSVSSFSFAAPSAAVVEFIRKHSVQDELRAISLMLWEECDLERSAVESIIDGVLIRSRIRKDSSESRLFLLVDAWCAANSGEYAYYVNARFGFLDTSLENWPALALLGTFNGSVGFTTRPSAISDAIKDATELAVTDFIYAHDT